MDSSFTILSSLSVSRCLVSDTRCLFVCSLFSHYSSLIPSPPSLLLLLTTIFIVLSMFFGNTIYLCFLSILIFACLLMDSFNLSSFSVVNISDFIHSTLTCSLYSTFFSFQPIFVSCFIEFKSKFLPISLKVLYFPFLQR